MSKGKNPALDKIVNPNMPIASVKATQPAWSFSRNLKLGSKGEDVRTLQKFLNQNGFAVAKTGSGSSSKETTIFDPRTLVALKKFQKSVKLPATGYFGILTRNYIKKNFK